MSNNNFDIAIVGMSGQFPQANNTQEYWQNLIEGKECLKKFTHSELLSAGIAESELSLPNYIPVAGILEDIDLFAAEFFGYSPKDAALIDPQQRKLLEHAWHALEDAGINPYRYPGIIGVFVGSSLNSYLLNNILSHPNVSQSNDLQQILFGNGQDYLATRIAYLLNLRGPAINIQTACSTSLVAVHEACQHLLSYQADAALAGGVSISVPQEKGYLYSVDGMLSPDGHCRAFSENAEGTVFSSGLGIVVLKRYADAVVDGDAIYAVIKGSAINNDGHQKMGYTAPSVNGQAEVIALAQGLAHVTPDQIGYVETHGTGTSLGDPIEISALQKVFSQTEKKQYCALGSVKSNIGHLDVAAGVAGLIKASLALFNKKIPPSLHCEQPTKKIDWHHSAFYINQDIKDWHDSKRRYAGVSSFGIGGTNAHVVLADVEAHPYNNFHIDKPAVLIFSAKSQDDLETLLKNFREYCEYHSSLSLHSLAFTLQQGRVEFTYRTAMIVDTINECIHKINQRDYSIVLCDKENEVFTPKSITQCNIIDFQHLIQKWLQGYRVDWSSHYPSPSQPQKLHLPVYPFKRSRYWIDPYKAQESDNNILNIDDWFYFPSWRRSITYEENHDHQNIKLLIFADFLSVDQAWINYITHEIEHITIVSSGPQFQSIDKNSLQMNFANTDDYVHLLDYLKSRDALPTHLLHTLTLTQTWQETNTQLFSSHQYHGLLSIIYFTQAWEKVASDRMLKLTVLTNRLNQIASECNVEPHKAPILSAIKVIPKEFTQIETQLIDINAVDYPQFCSYQLSQVKKELFKIHYDQEEIVYRGLQRWLRDYVATPIKSVTDKPEAVSENKVILITGGLGQLGLDIADYFTAYSKCKIALLSRSSLPDISIWDKIISEYESEHPLSLVLQRIMAMKNRGTIVEIFSVDVGDYDAVNHTIQEIEKSMGAITGVIHAAGETVNGIISLKSEASLQESYRAKVFGTYHLYQLFQHKQLDFLILCSSMNAIIGGLGQLDNTAANAFIDYMADYMAANTGLPVFAINWGAINVSRPMKVNVLSQFIDLSTEHKKNRMTNEEVNEVYDRLLSYKPSPRIVISTINMQAVLKNWNRVASIEELAKERKAYQQNIVRLLNHDEQPQTSVQKWISNLWCQLLGLEVIALSDNFFSLGGHSLAAVQFMTKIKETFSIKVHVMTLYELPTLHSFSEYLEKQFKQKNIKNDGIVSL